MEDYTKCELSGGGSHRLFNGYTLCTVTNVDCTWHVYHVVHSK